MFAAAKYNSEQYEPPQFGVIRHETEQDGAGQQEATTHHHELKKRNADTLPGRSAF